MWMTINIGAGSNIKSLLYGVVWHGSARRSGIGTNFAAKWDHDSPLRRGDKGRAYDTTAISGCNIAMPIQLRTAGTSDVGIRATTCTEHRSTLFIHLQINKCSPTLLPVSLDKIQYCKSAPNSPAHGLFALYLYCVSSDHFSCYRFLSNNRIIIGKLQTRLLNDNPTCNPPFKHFARLRLHALQQTKTLDNYSVACKINRQCDFKPRLTVIWTLF